jgi:uncharacterized protein (DUF305 family)
MSANKAPCAILFIAVSVSIITFHRLHSVDFPARSFRMKYPRFLKIASLCAGVALAGMPLTVNAQQSASMPGMDTSGSTDAGSNASTQAFKEADKKMMMDMSAPPYTGDPDQDFVAHMIPHHQGAVSMAQVELKYGKDPDMKRLAKKIVEAQDEEVAYMKSWQAKHGKK